MPLQYSKKYLDELLPKAKIVPAAIQLEVHPWLPQSEITEYSKEKGIHVIAYSPLGSTGSPLATVEPIVKLAEKKGTTPVSVLLSHHSKSSLQHKSPIRKRGCEWKVADRKPP